MGPPRRRAGRRILRVMKLGYSKAGCALSADFEIAIGLHAGCFVPLLVTMFTYPAPRASRTRAWPPGDP